MKNAIVNNDTNHNTLPVLLLGAALAATCAWASTVSAQDDTTPDAATPDTATDGETEGAADDGDASDGEAADGAAPDGATPADGADAGEDLEVDEGHDEIEAPEGLDEPAVTEPVETEPAETEPVETEPTETAGELTQPEEEAQEPETEEAAEAEDAAGPEVLPWRNTFFTWTNQVTFNSFFRDAQLSYNPTYQQTFSISPRWYIAPTTFFWANQTLQVELTDDDGNALNRDPQVADTVVEIRHMIPWEGFILFGQARVGLPISKNSQAAQRYLQTGLGVTIVRPVSELNLTLAGLFAYRRWWAGSNVVQVGEPQPDTCAPPPAAQATGGDPAPQLNTATCDQLGTSSAARDIMLYGLSVVWAPFSGFSVNLSAFGFTTYGYELAPAYVEVDTSEEPIRIDDGSPSHWNNFTYFALSVAYQFLPWLNVSLGIQNSGFLASFYSPDGNVRNPLFTPDTQVFLSASFQVDEIFNIISGNTEDDLTPEERQRRRQGLASGPSTGGTF